MFKLGIIEESLEQFNTLELLKPYIYTQRVEEIPGDDVPIWHINEYHVPDDLIEELLYKLKDEIKLSWYIHAFNDKQLFVVLHGKYFAISLYRDDTWDEMIEYGTNMANVRRHFLESIPLSV